MNADVTPMNADIRRSRLDRISYSVIGAAQTVSSALGFGFVEKVYENSLMIELAEAGLQVQQPVCLLLNFGRPKLEVKRIVWHF
jgi:hypothetical protein